MPAIAENNLLTFLHSCQNCVSASLRPDKCAKIDVYQGKELERCRVRRSSFHHGDDCLECCVTFWAECGWRSVNNYPINPCPWAPSLIQDVLDVDMEKLLRILLLNYLEGLLSSYLVVWLSYRYWSLIRSELRKLCHSIVHYLFHLSPMFSLAREINHRASTSVVFWPQLQTRINRRKLWCRYLGE